MWLAVSRLAILAIPFRRIAPYLGHTMVETPTGPTPAPAVTVQISWAVRTAGRYTPWESKCLALRNPLKATSNYDVTC